MIKKDVTPEERVAVYLRRRSLLCSRSADVLHTIGKSSRYTWTWNHVRRCSEAHSLKIPKKKIDMKTPVSNIIINCAHLSACQNIKSLQSNILVIDFLFVHLKWVQRKWPTNENKRKAFFCICTFYVPFEECFWPLLHLKSQWLQITNTVNYP